MGPLQSLPKHPAVTSERVASLIGVSFGTTTWEPEQFHSKICETKCRFMFLLTHCGFMF